MQIDTPTFRPIKIISLFTKERASHDYIENYEDNDIEIPPDNELPDIVGRNWLSDTELLKYLDEFDHEC